MHEGTRKTISELRVDDLIDLIATKVGLILAEGRGLNRYAEDHLRHHIRRSMMVCLELAIVATDMVADNKSEP